MYFFKLVALFKRSLIYKPLNETKIQLYSAIDELKYDKRRLRNNDKIVTILILLLLT